MGEAQPSPEWAGPAEWRMLGAHQLCDHIMARGEIIVGPFTEGIQAIFAPGVWSNTPADSEQQYTQSGWRHGIFLAPVYEPDSLEVKSIPEVVDLLLDEAPQFIEFVKKRSIITARNAAFITRLDSGGRSASAGTIEKWLANLDKVRTEATIAFGESWVLENLYPKYEEEL
jgi:hypothetical protein